MKGFKEIQFSEINRLKKIKFKSCLANLIIKEPGLVGASIQGKQQTGKSVYAMLIMYEIYQGDINKVFDNIVFSMDELKSKLRTAIERREKIRCILWDDASVHGSASHWMTNPIAVQELSQLGDTMGLATKGLILTSPSGDLIKAFRQYNFYQVKVALGRHSDDRVARGYLRGTSPYGQKYYSFVFEDNYNVKLSFYERYYTLREKLSLSALGHNETNNTKDEQPQRKITKQEQAKELYDTFKAGYFKEYKNLKEFSVYTLKNFGIGYSSLCNNGKLLLTDAP